MPSRDSRIVLPLLLAGLLLLATRVGAQQEPAARAPVAERTGLRLCLPFRGAAADDAAGPRKFAEGDAAAKLGDAWPGSLDLPAGGLVDPAAGTIAFRARRPRLRVTARNYPGEAPAWFLEHGDHGVRGWILDRAGLARYAVCTHPLKKDAWHHYALVWDRTAGLKLFVDGKPGTPEAGAERAWAHLTVPDRFLLQAEGLRDLCVFGRPLSQFDVNVLLARRIPDVPEREHAAPDETILSRLGYEAPETELLEVGEKPVLVRQVGIESARSDGVDMTWIHDGRPQHGWPDRHVDAARLLRIALETEPVNYVTLSGPVAGLDLVEPGEKRPEHLLTVPAGPAQFHARRLPERIMRHIHVRRPRSGTAPHLGPHLHEIRFFHIGPLRYLHSAEHISLKMLGLAEPEQMGAHLEELRALLPAGSRHVMRLSGKGNPRAKAVEIAPLQSLQLMSDIQQARFYAKGVLLNLLISTPHERDHLEVVIRDPGDSFRELLRIPLRLVTQQGRATVDLCLLTRGLLIDRDERLWIGIGSVKGGLKINPAASRITVLGGSPGRARSETAEQLFAIARKLYSVTPVPHKQSALAAQLPEHSPVSRADLVEQRALLTRALAIDPYHQHANITLRALQGQAIARRRHSVDVAEGIPAWAGYAREVLHANLRINHYWRKRLSAAEDRTPTVPVTASQFVAAALGEVSAHELLRHAVEQPGRQSLHLPLMLLEYGRPAHVLFSRTARPTDYAARAMWAWYSSDRQALEELKARPQELTGATLHLVARLARNEKMVEPLRKQSPALLAFEPAQPGPWRECEAEADRLIAIAARDRAQLRLAPEDELTFALAWRSSGRIDYLTEGLRLCYEELKAGEEYLCSDAGRRAELIPDAAGARLLGFAACGGVLPGATDPLPTDLHVTWPELDEDIVPLVTKVTAAALELTLVSFADDEREAVVRVWRPPVQPSVLALSNTAQRRESRTMLQTLLRGDRLRLRVSPGVNHVSIRTVAGPPAPQLLDKPDIAVGPEGLQYVPQTDQLRVRLVNLGTAPATRVFVSLYAEQRLLRILNVGSVPPTVRPEGGTICTLLEHASILDAPRLRAVVNADEPQITRENDEASVTWRPAPPEKKE